MKNFDPRYYTLDRLSPESLVLVENGLRRLHHQYNVPDWPIDCFQLLKVIQERGIINLGYQFVQDFAPTFDAVTTYFPEINGYWIVIRTPSKNWKAFSSKRRVNFTLAHELGHIFCNHVLIPKNLKTPEKLIREDEEADEFAARLLMPEKLILRSQFSSLGELSREFLVSDSAAFIRMNNLKRLDLLKTPKESVCPKCGNDQISPAALYCDICGEFLPGGGRKGVRVIEYNRYESDEWNRVTRCLVCENVIFSIEARYCRICGTPLHNFCDSDHIFSTCTHINSSGARFCELCGSQTAYYRRKVLSDWKVEKAEYLRSITQGQVEERKKKMIYLAPSMVDSDDKLISCPVCQNTEFDSAGFYCKICGNPRANFCSDEKNENCGNLNKANARYCEYCGSKTTFFKAGLLKPWDKVLDDEKMEEETPETFPTATITADETDELPF